MIIAILFLFKTDWWLYIFQKWTLSYHDNMWIFKSHQKSSHFSTKSSYTKYQIIGPVRPPWPPRCCAPCRPPRASASRAPPWWCRRPKDPMLKEVVCFLFMDFMVLLEYLYSIVPDWYLEQILEKNFSRKVYEKPILRTNCSKIIFF